MASEGILPLLGEDGVAIPIFVCTRMVYFFEIVCHPFFVFGQREVALFELPKFADFGRQTSRLRNPTQGGQGFRRKADSNPVIADSG